MAENKPEDWTDLKEVIRYAETLGPGFIVFRVNNRDHFGVCRESEIPKSNVNIGKFIIRKDLQERYSITYKTRGHV